MEQTSEDTLLADEFIGAPPSHLTRYGITFIFFFLTIIVVFSWFIDYSDTIKTTTTINSRTPTAIKLAEYDGVINQVLVNDGEKVKLGQVVMILNSDIDSETISSLKTSLQSNELSVHLFKPFISQHLGELRSEFQLMMLNLHQLKDHLALAKYKLQVEQLENDVSSSESKLNELNSQHQLMIQSSQIDEQKHIRSEQLKKDGLLSKSDSERIKKTHLNSQIKTNQLVVEQLALSASIQHKTKEIELLKIKQTEEINTLKLQLGLSQQKLLDLIAGWEKQHLLIAESSGIISIPYGNAPHQNIKSGQEIFSVIPNSSQLVGQVKVSENGTGKIGIGQQARIKLMSYPFEEFGEIEGQVINISPSIHDQMVFLDIEISGYDSTLNQIKTSYGKKIRYIPSMQGQVEIITTKKNLLSRIFENLVSHF